MTHIFGYAAGTERLDLKAVRLNQAGTLRINLSRIILALKILVSIILGLGIAREAVMAIIGTETVLKDLRHFTLDAERSLPTWYESSSMVAIAFILGIIAALSRSNDRENTRHWTILAIIFLLMSVDSTVSFHEVAVAPLRNAFHLTGAFYFSWVVLAAPMVAAVGFYYLPFLFRLPGSTALRFILAGAVYVGGALGTEFLCGYIATAFGMETALYKTVAASQEILESVGLTMFLIGLLRHLGSLASLLRIDIRAEPA